MLKIVISIAVILTVLIFLLYRMIPKGTDIEKSGYFDKAQVEDAMKETIELLDAEDYAALQEKAIPQMKTVLAPETMGDVKGQIAGNWGKRATFGKAYIGEMIYGCGNYCRYQYYLYLHSAACHSWNCAVQEQKSCRILEWKRASEKGRDYEYRSIQPWAWPDVDFIWTGIFYLFCGRFSVRGRNRRNSRRGRVYRRPVSYGCLPQ